MTPNPTLNVEAAVNDPRLANELSLARELTGPDDLRFNLHPALAGDLADLRLNVVSYKAMSLTTIMPHLAALGIQVTDERPALLDTAAGTVRLYDLGFRHLSLIHISEPTRPY